MKTTVLSLFLFFSFQLYVGWNFVFAQEVVKIEFQDSLKVQFPNISFPTSSTDSLNLELQLDTLASAFHNAGYLAAGSASWIKEGDVYSVSFDTGNHYTWLEISAGNVSPELLETLGFFPDFWKNKPVHAEQLAKIMSDLVAHYANNGYPFASIKLDSIVVEGDKVKGRFNLKKNKVFRFDSINIISEVDINPRFLERMLGINKGSYYDQSKINEIPRKIRTLAFVRLDKAPSVRFKGNSAVITLTLVPYQSSRFDVLIGIIPDESARNNFRITGNISADLFNKLGQGEYAGFRYKSITQGTQELSLELNYPYLLNLPFGVNTAFRMYSNTNLNRDIDLKVGIQYQINSDQQFSIYWQNNSSRLMDIDTAKIIAQQKLPSNLDIRLNGLGVNFKYQNLNYRFNPRSGLNLSLNGTAGLKEVLPNQEIQSIKNEWIDFNNSYDTIQNGYQFSCSGLIEYFVPIGKVFTIKGANHSGIKISKQRLFRNEAFRIGGSHILRGFDEESLYTNRYSVFTLETRLLISTNSYFFIFGDYGLLSVRLEEEELFDTPYGIGAGLSLDTGSGVLLISAALGSQMNLPLDFGSSKVHIGYVNLF